MNQFFPATEAQELFNVGAATAHDLGRVGIGIADNAARHFDPIRAEHAHRVSRFEAAGSASDPSWQQTLPGTERA